MTIRADTALLRCRHFIWLGPPFALMAGGQARQLERFAADRQRDAALAGLRLLFDRQRKRFSSLSEARRGKGHRQTQKNCYQEISFHMRTSNALPGIPANYTACAMGTEAIRDDRAGVQSSALIQIKCPAHPFGPVRWLGFAKTPPSAPRRRPAPVSPKGPSPRT